MLGIHVSVPVACFRKGLAREFLETEFIPPPATCYGFLLSLVGETNSTKHVGTRVTATLLNRPQTSVVLRTVWRLKKPILGSSGNTRPDYQQLLTGLELVIWVDSTEERNNPPVLEKRVQAALDPISRGKTERFGGLSLGESTHLVDSVSLLTDDLRRELIKHFDGKGVASRTYLKAEQGLLGLPVWIDHVGSAGTVHVVGDLFETPGLEPPPVAKMPKIQPRKDSA